MKYSDVIKAVELTIAADDVPLIVGESGIGKTALVREVAKRNKFRLITVDANLLKEGEIGGLPTIEKGRTVYAPHSKLVQIEKELERGYKVLLFIDELNRCDHAVQQEIMNIILNREINGFFLEKDVSVVAAINPSNKYNEFEDAEYDVVEMDPAQEDRFVWLEMESNVKEWIKWGMTNGEIDSDVLEFISTFPEYLNTPQSQDSIKSTPRSFERVSKAYKIYKENKDRYSFEVFLATVKGNIGVSIANDFANFIREKKKPMIDPNDIFCHEVVPSEIVEKIKEENNSRLYILARGCMNLLERLRMSKREVSMFGEILKYYPRDLRLGIMKEIKAETSEEFYKSLLETDEFREAFFGIYE